MKLDNMVPVATVALRVAAGLKVPSDNKGSPVVMDKVDLKVFKVKKGMKDQRVPRERLELPVPE